MRKNVLFVGGLCEGRRSVEAIGDALIDAGADDVEAATASYARKHPSELSRLSSMATVVGTHSIGAELLLRVDTPRILYVFNPPIPTPRHLLVGRGALIAANMLADAAAQPTLRYATARYLAGYAAEALRHPKASFLPVANGEISEYDTARRLLLLPKDVETEVTYVHTLGDEFFQPTLGMLAALCARGARIAVCMGGREESSNVEFEAS
jgi:hypothetical protein